MTKRQQSSIDRLPDDVRKQLQAMLRDPRVTQLEATARINEILDADGHPERLSKSAVNRYAVRMEEVGAKIREAREVSRMWIGELGSEPAGEVGKLLNEMVRALAFDLTSSIYEGEGPVDPKTLKNLAISVHRLEQAAERNVRLEREIRQRAKAEAAEAVESEAKRQGASAATIDSLRAAIMQELKA
jgi:hypothetical protein